MRQCAKYYFSKKILPMVQGFETFGIYLSRDNSCALARTRLQPSETIDS
jgi:hypothetical protein